MNIIPTSGNEDLARRCKQSLSMNFDSSHVKLFLPGERSEAQALGESVSVYRMETVPGCWNVQLWGFPVEGHGTGIGKPTSLT